MGIVVDGMPRLGPYSHAYEAGGFMFVSGCTGIDSEGKLVGGRIEEQTEETINNIEKILKAAKLSLKDVVRAEVYLKDLDHFKAMNEVYRKRFSEPYPARHAMQVARLPGDALVEITCIAKIRAKL